MSWESKAVKRLKEYGEMEFDSRDGFAGRMAGVLGPLASQKCSCLS